ncbi:TPA: dynamin family protein [Mannheimia haemolytica]
MNANIEIKYNPFVLKNRTDFLLNGKVPSESSKLYGYKDLMLQSWIDHLFDDLSEAYNQEKQFSLSFYGTEVDCEDMRNAVETARKKGFQIDYSETVSEKNAAERLSELEAMMQDMAQNELYQKAIQEHSELNLAREGYLDILVVAPVSSGKSTFINALLGCDLLTTARKATTAAITEIQHNPEMKQGIFYARRFNNQHKQLGETERLDLTNVNSAQHAKLLFSEWNKDRDSDKPAEKKTDRIQLEGCFVGIQLTNKNIKLRIYDTPGTDNERNKAHLAVTMNKIQDRENHPLIIYLLTPERYEGPGSYQLLNRISEELKKQGKLASDRFIFAINRADEYFGEEGGIAEKIDDMRSVLKDDFEIQNPKLYPICSDLVRNLRIKELNPELNTKKHKNLSYYEETILDDDDHDLNRYMTLNHRVQTKLDALPDSSLKRSGIPALELMISDYIEKYYEPQRIARISEALKQVIYNVKLGLQNTIEMTDKTPEELDDLIQKLEKAKENLGKSEDFRHFISEMKAKETALSSTTTAFFREFQKELNKLFSSEENHFKQLNDENVAQRIITQFSEKIKELMIQFQSELISVNKSEQKSVLNDLNNAYTEFVKEKFGEVFGDINAEIKTNLIQQTVNLQQYLSLKNYTEKRTYKEEIEQNFLEKIANKIFFGAFFKPEFKTKTETVIYLDKAWRNLEKNLRTDLGELFEQSAKNLKMNSRALTEEYCEALHTVFEEKVRGFMRVTEENAKAPDLKQRIVAAKMKLDFNKKVEETVNSLILL